MTRVFLGVIFIIGINLFNDYSCDKLQNGSFELYEKGLKIGHIYRKNGIQVEKYIDKKDYIIAKIKSEDCIYYMKSYEVKEDLDTITWEVSYKKIKPYHYSFIGKPKYLDNKYSYEGEIKKIDDLIEPKMLKVFENLESK